MSRRPSILTLCLVLAAACAGKGDEPTTSTTDPTTTPQPTGPTDPTQPTEPTTTEPDTALTDTGPTIDPARYEAVLAQFEADFAAADASGASLAILEDGVVTWTATVGSARPDADVPVDADTLFQLGSTTKMFTAVALLQAVERGDVAIDGPLADALPGWDMAADPGAFDTITPHHLLTHQTAMYDRIDWTSVPRDSYLEEWLDEYTQTLGWLMAEPGRFMNYSNPGFGFAGLIAQRHDPLGRDYGDLVIDDVFTPLGMPRTFFKKTEAEADGNYAVGRGISLTGEPVDYSIDEVQDNASARPAGACTWTTPSQQLQMARFLMDGDASVLDDDLRQQLVARQVPMLESNDTSYGYGLMVGDGIHLEDGYHPAEVWAHGGNTLAYTSEFYVLPEHGFAISILSSGYGQSFAGTAATAMQELVELPPPVDPPAWPFDPERLDDHVGSYTDVLNGTFTVSRDGDGLAISWPFLEQYGYVVAPQLLPISHDLWVADLSGYPLTLAFVGEVGQPSEYAVNRILVGEREAEVVSSRRAAPTPRLEHVPDLLLPPQLRRGQHRVADGRGDPGVPLLR
jgi:CubicO group peptidase (beta-lactamase class C family)